jgi:hypothetical protein
MYASNHYDKEMVRVPKNYGGNAFSREARPENDTPRQEIWHTNSSDVVTTEEPMMPELRSKEVFPPRAERKGETQNDGENDVSDAETTTNDRVEDVAGGDGGDNALSMRQKMPLSRLALGQEELLLLGLLFLLRGEQGGSDNDEIWWLLFL